MKVCGIVNLKHFNGLWWKSLPVDTDQRLVVDIAAVFILIKSTRLVVRTFLVGLSLFIIILCAVCSKTSQQISESVHVSLSTISFAVTVSEFIFHSIIPIGKRSPVHSVIVSRPFACHYHLLHWISFSCPSHINMVICQLLWYDYHQFLLCGVKFRNRGNGGMPNTPGMAAIKKTYGTTINTRRIVLFLFHSY